jgi:hypothetical protein
LSGHEIDILAQSGSSTNNKFGLSIIQTPADPAILQRVLATTQAQRNQLLDALNVSDARTAGLADELAKAQARVKELEPKPDAAPK